MDLTCVKEKGNFGSRSEWRFGERCLLVTLYLFFFIIQSNCQTIPKETSHIENTTKRDINSLVKLNTRHCHSCQISNNNISNKSDSTNFKDKPDTDIIDKVITTISNYTESIFSLNKTEKQLEIELEHLIDDIAHKDQFEVIDGIKIKRVENGNTSEMKSLIEDKEGRAMFSSYTYEYRLFQKIKNFIHNHIISFDLPKAARVVGFRSFGLKKFLLPVVLGIQFFKLMLFAMFLPSIVGSFGKILGKGLSQISAASNQASFLPAVDDQMAYNNDNKDIMATDTDTAGAFLYPQDTMLMAGDPNEINDMAVDMSRFGLGGTKVGYMPAKNAFYKNQMQVAATNNFKVFQRIPASSMILSNYDPFYSPLLSRLDGIFARLGLAPSENAIDSDQLEGPSLSDMKLEACREQLICLMYGSPGKYAPYSNLVSAQLSRELNELRRPVSDNPEILRFFRYMRAARRGQEGTDCLRMFPACAINAVPQHTMIAAYHDINKLVSARKLYNY